METILVVDDELKIARLLRDYLEQAGFAVVTAATGEAAVATARSVKPDLVLLDLGLPGMDGLDVARALRRYADTPIVMVTARTEEMDRIVGLELGADDYVTKPFSPREVVARVRAVLRRTSGGAGSGSIVRASDVEIDIDHRTVTRGGTKIPDLTPSEFDLLVTLASEQGRVFTRTQIADAMHGVGFESRAVDAHVKNLRRKLEPEPSEPTYIETVHGVGYRFADA